jgi:DNA-binding NtrC family response regulator
MAALAPSVRAPVQLWRPAPNPICNQYVRALVVSPELGNRKPLLRTLEALQVDIIVCTTRVQAEQILVTKRVDIVFCDGYLPDGRYSDLVLATSGSSTGPPVVVTTRTGDWDLYFAALDEGAFDVIRCPCYAQDVEMTIVRSLTEQSSQIPSSPEPIR